MKKVFKFDDILSTGTVQMVTNGLDDFNKMMTSELLGSESWVYHLALTAHHAGAKSQNWFLFEKSNPYATASFIQEYVAPDDTTRSITTYGLFATILMQLDKNPALDQKLFNNLNKALDEALNSAVIQYNRHTSLY